MQGFHFVRINVALTDFNFSEGASRQVAAEHLELGGELFLRQVIDALSIRSPSPTPPALI